MPHVVGRSLASLALLIGLVAGSSPGQDICDRPFYPGEIIETLRSPFDVATADIDGDGFLDVVAVHLEIGETLVYRNRGDATFTLKSFTAGQGPRSVAVGDLDRDGRPDIVIGNSNGNVVSVLRNVGEPGSIRFDPVVEYPAGTRCESVKLGDLNQDGFLDVVAINQVSDDMTILINDGTGSFFGEDRAQTGDRPLDVELGDLNDDGHLDAVVASALTNDVRVLIGRGDGDFMLQTRHPVGLQPMSVALDDMDGDGDLDIVAANRGSNDVSLLRNRGDATFDPEERSVGGSGDVSIESHDIDHDGDPDILLTIETIGEIRVLLNDGDGHLDPLPEGIIGVHALRMAFGDFDDDGVDDLVVTRRDRKELVVLNGLREGGFGSHRRELRGTLPRIHASADFDGDGDADLAVGTLTETIEILLNRGDATFEHASTIPSLDLVAGLALIDVDVDGDTDICATLPAMGSILVIRNDGSGTFDGSTTTAIGGEPFRIAGADMTGDGVADLVICDLEAGSLKTLVNDGSGVFDTILTLPARPEPDHLRLVDGDLDGDADVYLAHASGFDFYANDGSGVLTRRSGASFAGRTTGFAVGDFSQDGRGDVVVATIEPGLVSYVRWYTFGGNGSFALYRLSAAFDDPRGLAFADVDNDSVNEIVILDPGRERFEIYKRIGSNFSNRGRFAADLLSGEITVDDFDGDGRPDLAAASIAGLDVILNQCPDPCLADWNRDDEVDVFDTIEYLADFADFREEADLTRDGTFDVFDILAFLDAFDAGCP